MSIFHQPAGFTYSNSPLFTLRPYTPPAWIAEAIPSRSLPATRVKLGCFPTPIHRWSPLEEEGEEQTGVEFWIKRDDLSSNDLSGNKVRKLEFLLSAALDGGHDSVVTIGGVQSNHARATAVAARQLGLDPYLLLRTRSSEQDDPSILNGSVVGNLLFNRFVDAEIHTVTASTYATIGSTALLAQLTEQLVEKGRNPFPIPVGGSCPLGAFGYLEAIEEIKQQELMVEAKFDHLVFACGSGGTAAGLAIGARLCGIKSVHAVGVCDSPDYFYGHIRDTAMQLGLNCGPGGGDGELGDAKDWLTIHHGAGIGYARSTTEELEFLLGVSRRTGIVLDPVYSGKALYVFCNQILRSQPQVFKRGDRVLFIHTGGTLGMYDKAEQLRPMLEGSEKAPRPLHVRRP